MPAIYKKIASVTVGSGGASTIDFTSIPTTYTDLCVLVSLKSARNAEYDYPYIRFNDSTTNYSCIQVVGNGSTAASYTDTSIYFTIKASGSGTTTASVFSNTQIYIPNYAGSNNKSVSVDSVSEYNGTSAQDMFVAGLWSNTSAINKVTIYNGYSTTWVEFSTATLYGISKS